MSFANILSEPATYQPTRMQSPMPAKSTYEPSKDQPARIEKVGYLNCEGERPALASTPAVNGDSQVVEKIAQQTNGYSVAAPKPRRVLTATENEKIASALSKIDAAELSDVDDPGFEAEEALYSQKRKKRALEVDEIEAEKRKVRAEAV
jgi:chromatin-remodeling ATPase INO80